MQDSASVTWEPVVQTSTLKTWHLVVAVFLFACVVYAVVWWARKRSESAAGSLGVDRSDSSLL
jgi:hypothetical protein